MDAVFACLQVCADYKDVGVTVFLACCKGTRFVFNRYDKFFCKIILVGASVFDTAAVYMCLGLLIDVYQTVPAGRASGRDGSLHRVHGRLHLAAEIAGG